MGIRLLVLPVIRAMPVQDNVFHHRPVCSAVLLLASVTCRIVQYGVAAGIPDVQVSSSSQQQLNNLLLVEANCHTQRADPAFILCIDDAQWQQQAEQSRAENASGIC